MSSRCSRSSPTGCERRDRRAPRALANGRSTTTSAPCCASSAFELAARRERARSASGSSNKIGSGARNLGIAPDASDRRRRLRSREMPRYVVERECVDGFAFVPDAAAIERNADDGVTWVHSYVSVTGTKTFCIYDAPSPEAIRKTSGAQRPAGRAHHPGARARSVLLRLNVRARRVHVAGAERLPPRPSARRRCAGARSPCRSRADGSRPTSRPRSCGRSGCRLRREQRVEVARLERPLPDEFDRPVAAGGRTPRPGCRGRGRSGPRRDDRGSAFAPAARRG